MKWSNFNLIICFGIILSLLPFTTSAQNSYDRRIEGYQSKWQKLIPTYTKLQYAGGMGLLSVGTGWDYGKNRQWETDIFFGFVPKYSTDKNKITFTLKQNYIPWNANLGKGFSIDPLTCGLYANTVFGGDFWTSEPDKYPNSYYSFSTKMRFNIYIGQRLTYKISREKRHIAKSVTLFYELSSNDLYIVSAFTNSYLKPRDYLKLSFGVKLQIL